MGVGYYDCSADAVQNRGASALAGILSQGLVADQ